MHDPYLHTFLDESEISLKQQLWRMVHPARRESLDPVLAANGGDEGTAIGYASAVRRAEDDLYLLWYMCHNDGVVRVASSNDGRQWQRRGPALEDPGSFSVDNLAIVPVADAAHGWFHGASWAGYFYGSGTTAGGAPSHGLHWIRSLDGEHLEVRTPGFLPGVGDRSTLYYDELKRIYTLISRPSRRAPGMRAGELLRPRVANLWQSRDLADWENLGVVLTYDEADPAQAEIYGMQPFRYGRGFLAWVEIYYRNVERLETQLAHSADGVHWTRVEPRQPTLPLGAEGTWDAYWAVPTNNPPFLVGDRLFLLYSGAGTKHGSKARHRRGIGLASLRRDGWVSLEAGRSEGILVTQPLPLERPMQLQLNVNCYSGYITAEVVSTAPGREGEAIAGYAGEAGRLTQVDAVRQPLRWGERSVVQPVPEGRCYLRFTTQQSSFFAYRWSPAD